MPIVRCAVRVIQYLWAGPYTFLGLLLAASAFLGGASGRIYDGTLEVAGGCFGVWISRLPVSWRLYAVTLGHVIVGVSPDSLSVHRRHEHVHVRQYERWGPMFIPVYLASSLVQWLRGRDPYRDNCFEREACLQITKLK